MEIPGARARSGRRASSGLLKTSFQSCWLTRSQVGGAVLEVNSETTNERVRNELCNPELRSAGIPSVPHSTTARVASCVRRECDAEHAPTTMGDRSGVLEAAQESIGSATDYPTTGNEDRD
jgi:hypothetical protein